MTKKRLQIPTLAMCLVLMLSSSFLTGCLGENDKVSVYYTNKAGTKLTTLDYHMKASSDDYKGQIMELLNRMDVSPKDEEHVVIKPAELEILSVDFDNNTCTVNFNNAYTKLDHLTELLYRTAVIKTLSQITKVDKVNFFCEGSELVLESGTKLTGMKSSQYVDDSNDKDTAVEWRDIDLYFANAAGDKLVRSHTVVAYNKNMSLEKIIVSKLIAGPTESGLNATLPNTMQVLSVSTKDRVCYVNLSTAFLTDLVNVTGDIPIYSIVNSLCELDQIDSVRIMVNGDSTKIYHESTSLDQTFNFNYSYVQ